MLQRCKKYCITYIWPACVGLLALALLGAATGWPLLLPVTLGFFMFVPGFLIFSRMRYQAESAWVVAAFSLGLSLLFLMVAGLLLNSLYYVGLKQPLSSPYIIATLGLLSAGLIVMQRRVAWHIIFRKPALRTTIATIALSCLPLLAAAGAIRLNNGASNILTLVLFGTIAAVFLFFTLKKRWQGLYPYALLMIAVSVLLSVSLRGWGITGHDIQREFHVFQLAMQSGFWDIAAFRDPYNACLSITILPTLLAKITHIADPYIFKVVFQVMFAFAVIPIYFFIKKLADARLAFMGAFLFISFPTFINDLPMLNRQEISFIFFGLLMLLMLTTMQRRQKKFLTILLLLGAILSHYSSSYTIVGLLLAAWLVYYIFCKITKQDFKKDKLTLVFPTLNMTVILVALLFTFLWNSQITGTTAGLQKTVSKTVSGLFAKSSAQASDVAYSLFGRKAIEPQVLLEKHVAGQTNNLITVQHVKEQDLPLTAGGKLANNVVDMASLHRFIRSSSAKFLQLMLLIGCVILFVAYQRKPTQQNAYFFALSTTCVAFLIFQTLLPQLSVDYGILRLFQQELVILALPTVLGIIALFRWWPRLKVGLAAGVLALMFLHFSGFIPQLTGGYPPQLALNNKGFYYDAYYITRGEELAADWLVRTRTGNEATSMDLYAQWRFTPEERAKLGIIAPYSYSSRAYIYKDRVNTVTGAYIANINSNLYYYTAERTSAYENQLYSNGQGTVSKISGTK